MENKKEEKRNILNGIYNQISSFDNKASILLSVIGIVFALSLNFLSIFHEDRFMKSPSHSKILFYIFFFVFCLFAFLSIASFVMVIIPRVGRSATNSPNYYKNISEMNISEIEKAIEDGENNNYIVEQIKINGDLCMKKHNWLMCGIYCLIPFTVSIIMLIILIV